jgi:hypothetical protein
MRAVYRPRAPPAHAPATWLEARSQCAKQSIEQEPRRRHEDEGRTRAAPPNLKNETRGWKCSEHVAFSRAAGRGRGAARKGHTHSSQVHRSTVTVTVDA